MTEPTLIKLGKIDGAILQILQEDSRITHAKLARQIELTTTPCIERVRKFKENGSDKQLPRYFKPGVFSGRFNGVCANTLISYFTG